MTQIGGEIELEHVHRYLWAEQFSRGKRVLDIACGEGYGSEILARSAAHVIGVDLSKMRWSMLAGSIAGRIWSSGLVRANKFPFRMRGSTWW